MKIFYRVLFQVLIMFMALHSYAQKAVVSGGGNLVGQGGSVSYSVGQVAYTTRSAMNGAAAAGVQQPYEISVITGADELSDIILNCKAYPNPTSDFLNLKIEHSNPENILYQLYNTNGALILQNKIYDTETSIPLSGFAPAIYYLHVTANNKELKTFKIIKH